MSHLNKAISRIYLTASEAALAGEFSTVDLLLEAAKNLRDVGTPKLFRISVTGFRAGDGNKIAAIKDLRAAVSPTLRLKDAKALVEFGGVYVDALEEDEARVLFRRLKDSTALLKMEEVIPPVPLQSEDSEAS
jgi:ribosomal protein L7/L12